ncbi:MAG: type 4a pilus biogenesis protein PilO [Candidatus Omnitrophica bacterium]|nr:type 4a pilus biogenesis protein PilO [Candidatus Omnitrophota bacterium]MBU1128125.1 type 4a pilus biogenesis protein PilO [Candidatus Omnitrophota bacterium]MBU1657090.1 type 4a pilus biogenesis protein PilO [Candidatus Omnitrophota bacterium]MBU1784879.1 type 4a pilus biogenesis protein PilO [Candidatus Omnitrophota bacterium]MBU1850817.1 type 4a pilus biogenesis protein PilO [Candidatus Omnitrophota bacterium]
MKKIDLIKRKSTMLIPMAVLAAVIGIFLIFYIPLIKKSRVVYTRCELIEGKTRKAKNIIRAASAISGRRVLMQEEDVSYVTDELTRLGKREGVDFIAIRPGEIKAAKAAEYKILPVELRLGSTYRQLGMFLGSLDDMEKSLVTVRSFNVVPDPENASKLITDMVVDVYLSGRENGSAVKRQNG